MILTASKLSAGALLRRLLHAGLACVAVAFFSTACHRKPAPAPAPMTAPTPTIEQLWKAAADKVEENRNEPSGIRADVTVPEQLKRYANPHMFLATQAAEAHRTGFQLPGDYCDLANLASSGQLVELPIVTPEYVLFGIGGITTDGPITYYDSGLALSIPLFPSDEAYKAWLATQRDEVNSLDGGISLAKIEMSRLKRGDRARRATLRATISKGTETLARVSAEIQQADLYYRDPLESFSLFDRYKALSKIASSFVGKTYDLTNPASRLEFKDRLLCFVRPTARDVITELAGSYKKEFNRPLPITSLIRTEEYQHDLAGKNPNAARNATPPHTTGLAFDVYYHYMTAREQEFLMGEIAKLKDAGRVEALKETRDHFHVFAYADGKRPSEELIAQSVGELETERPRFTRVTNIRQRQYYARSASPRQLRRR